jgi:hypothetical protein
VLGTACLCEHLGIARGNSRRLEQFEEKEFKNLFFSLNLFLESSYEWTIEELLE